MKTAAIAHRRLARVAIALVWLYQGLWCKVLGGEAQHLVVISAVPFIGPTAGRMVLVALGLFECGLGVWVLTGRRLVQAAIVQTLLLVAMNAGAIVWSRSLLPDPIGMLLQNFAFVVLIWSVAEIRPHVAHT
jgi:hypothetical protein